MADNSLYNLYSIDAAYIHKQQPLDFDDSGQETKPAYKLWEIVTRLRGQRCGNDNQIFYSYLHDHIRIIPALGMEQKKFQSLMDIKDEAYRTTLKGELIGNAISELKISRNKTYLPYLLAWLWHDHPDDIKKFYTKIGLEYREFPSSNDLEQIKKAENNCQSENTSASISASSYQSIQPRLTIPQARGENTNYFANAVLDVIGRDEQKARLKAFLECDKNVAWFQLAGVAGQGKSRLAYDLIKVAEGLGFRAGFLTENDIQFFKDQWNDWQPDKPHLLIFDYVIGREEQIKPIFQILIFNQDNYRHNIRILLVERQRWDQGSVIKIKDQSDKDSLGLSMHIGDKAPWFLNLCAGDDSQGERLLGPCRFENGVEELKKLDQEDLVTIVKQLSEKELTLSDDELKQTLERIDDTGRPLYAYLLAQQLNESETGYRSWTKIDLLNYQLIRDKNRWQQVFKEKNKKAPTWGDSHDAMKLAVLATIVRQVSFEDEIIKSSFDETNESLGREAMAITSSYLINDNNNPHKIYALEPDLLGEWFVLFCFYKRLKFEELLNLAWKYSPNETAIFLQRITQDFIDLSEKYGSWNLTEKLLAYVPLSENFPKEEYYQALAKVAVTITDKLYIRDLSIPQNIITALKYGAKSDPNAMSFLGFLYQQGIGVTRNSEKGVILFQQAVDKNDGAAMILLGVCYKNGEGIEQNSNKALELFQRAIGQGNNAAWAYLGICYQYGIGVKQDWKKAIDLYREGEKKGDNVAIFNLGFCFEKGIGIEQDWSKAIDLYQQAAKQGFSAAMINLGICYEKGIGIEQDWSKASDLYRQAAKQGDSRALVKLGLCYENGIEVNQDWNKAVDLYQKAVKKGNSDAMARLAFCYQKGLGIEQDWGKAIDLYHQAVKHGDSAVMVYLGSCYQKGEGVEQDFNKAVDLYQKATEQDDSTAMVSLAFCYQRGLGIEQDWGKAINLYHQAVKHGDSTAMFILGILYQEGQEVPQDWNKAINLFWQAAKAGMESAIYNIQNILGAGNYKAHKINGWSNNKLLHLTAAPLFDSPIMAGKWKHLTAEEIKICLNKIIIPFEILELSEISDDYIGQYGRFIPLSFYKDCNLVEIQLCNPSNNNTIVFSAIFNSERAFLLTGKQDIIHAINPYLLSLNSKESTIAYLVFFYSYILGENGPYQIISSINEIAFDEDVNQHIQDEIKSSLFSPHYIEGNFAEEGWQTYGACVLYENALYITIFKIFPNGNISIEFSDRIFNELPILRRQYNGIFRIPILSLK